MKTSFQSLAIATAIALTSAMAPAYAASNPTVGGAPMLVTKDIVDNAVNSRTTPPWSPRSRPLAWSTR